MLVSTVAWPMSLLPVWRSQRKPASTDSRSVSSILSRAKSAWILPFEIEAPES